MKNLVCLIALVATIFAVQPTFAQSSARTFTQAEKVALQKPQYKSTVERSRIMTDKMATQLNLNTQQRQAIYNINLSTAQKIEQLRRARITNVQSFKASVKAANLNRDASIKRLLSQEQLATYNAQKQRIKAMKGNAQ